MKFKRFCSPVVPFIASVVMIVVCGWIAPAVAQDDAAGPRGISLVWSKNVGGLRSFALSPHARRLAMLTTEGKLALWTAQEAVPVWAASKQTTGAVLVSDGNGLVLTYNKCSLLEGVATLRRADSGVVVWTKDFDAALWSAAFSQDGGYMAIGTGDNNVSIFDLDSDEAETKVDVAGTPISVAFSYDNNSVLVGQWDRSGVACLDLNGKTMWRASGATDRKYTISSIDQHFVTYIGSSNRQGRSPVVYLVRSSTGELLWAYNLEDLGYNAVAATNDSAGITCLSFSKPSRLTAGSMPEQRLACIDRSGNMIWEKGGLFWAPTLICLTPDESGLLVYDGNRTIYRLDSEGRTVAHAFLSDQLRQWSVSLDRTSLVVYTHDGQMSLLHIE